jgi:hypothetical protein
MAIDRIEGADDYLNNTLNMAGELWDIWDKNRNAATHWIPTTCADHAALGRCSELKM